MTRRRPRELRTRAARRVVRAATVCAVVLAAVVGATPAWAHVVLIGSSPSAGSTVGAVPESVVLTFDQPALDLGTVVEVTGPDGDIAFGSPVLVDTTVRQTLRAGSAAGTYEVYWRVTSADTHVVSGSFAFTATAAGGDPTATAVPAAAGGTGSAAGSSQSSLLWWVLAAAVVVMVGAVAVRIRHPRESVPTRKDGP